MKKQENKSYLKHIRNAAIIFTVSVVVTFLFGGFSTNWLDLATNIAYGTIIGLSIALGSSIISKKMLNGDNWLHNPVRRFMMVILAVTLYIIVDVLLVNFTWFYMFQDASISEMFHSGMFMWSILTELMIGMIIYLIIISSRFAKSLNEFYVEAEAQKQELNHYKYATLKNQVNPHFLFNSLNVLSALIYKDAEKADDFVEKLSNIYRYVLDVQDEEVVSVSREVDFAKDYLALQAVRFGNYLKYDINVSSNKMIVPMALQILIENALKHNEISAQHILEIKISNDEHYLIVTNNVKAKESSETSHELGLDNIKGRYKFLSNQEVKISQTADTFEVAIPLLDLK